MRIKNKSGERNLKSGGLVRRLALVFGMVAGGLIVVTVFVSVSFASKGSQLMAVEREIARVTTENSGLSEQVVRLTSVSGLLPGIEETDFVDPEVIEYLSSDLARQPDIMAKLP